MYKLNNYQTRANFGPKKVQSFITTNIFEECLQILPFSLKCKVFVRKQFKNK